MTPLLGLCIKAHFLGGGFYFERLRGGEIVEVRQ